MNHWYPLSTVPLVVPVLLLTSDLRILMCLQEQLFPTNIYWHPNLTEDFRESKAHVHGDVFALVLRVDILYLLRFFSATDLEVSFTGRLQRLYDSILRLQSGSLP